MGGQRSDRTLRRRLQAALSIARSGACPHPVKRGWQVSRETVKKGEEAVGHGQEMRLLPMHGCQHIILAASSMTSARRVAAANANSSVDKGQKVLRHA